MMAECSFHEPGGAGWSPLPKAGSAHPTGIRARRAGVGCDCIGLIRGIWRELYGKEPEPVPPYAPDWAERSGDERLLQAALRLFGPALPLSQAQPGDILLFRWRQDCPAKHAGILVAPDHFIHAYEQAAVIRSTLVPSWRRRIAAVHRFGEVG